MNRTSTVKRPAYSASNALECVSRALHEIKHDDRLTWADIGAVLGKSDDMAAKYADGTATMDFITYGRARKEWGKRFTGYFDRLCGDVSVGDCSDRRDMNSVVRVLHAMADSLEDDDRIDVNEVRQNMAAFSSAFDALGRQMQKVHADDLGGVQ